MVTASARIARLLTLVPWLRANDGITIAEAATHFQITPDQLEKDLWLLIVCGVPGYGPDQLIDIDFWDDGHIHVRDPQTLDVPLRLSFEEAATLIIALRLLAQLPGATDAVHSALDKLIAATDIERIGIQMATEPDPAIITVIDQAVQASTTIRLQYASGSDDRISERTVTPLRTLSVDGRHLLVAYCHEAEAERTFRIDRIVRAALDTEAPRRQIATEPRPPLQVTCVLAPEARWVADVHPCEEAEELPDGRLRVRMAVYDPAWVVALMLRLGGAGEVLEPADVRTAVADAAQSALASYARATSTGRL